jgi:putative ABC transport system permease protein
VQYVLGCVMIAVFLCAALVLISVFAHAVTQRRPQMALLQVLGFSRGVLLGSFALEGSFIMLVAAGMGIGIGLLTLHLLPAALGQFFGNFAIPAWTWWGLPIWLSALLAAALVAPSIVITRLRPVDVRAA